MEISGGNNRWNLNGNQNDNKKFVHWIIKPEFRYWTCERFTGHFFGLHAFYGQYNIGGWNVALLFEEAFRYEGSVYGAGISYGYHLPLSKHWGVEFNIGAGVAQLSYIKKDCIKCGSQVGDYNMTYFGPTALGLKIVYMIK